MRLSRSFSPTLKETPADAHIASHQLMLRAGLVKQLASGIYAWLPMGLKVLRNISSIVRSHLNEVGGQELLMPTLQSKELWQRSGRYDSYGPEMLRMEDRHKRTLIYSPTNEEMITDLVGQSVSSYKDLPSLLYQIQWKFRDEIRPRFGVMRGREFYMQDGYSFDLDPQSARLSYYKMMVTYLRVFRELGVRAVPMRAATGEMGGELSHEFLILAPTGESEVFYDSALEEIGRDGEECVHDPQQLTDFFKRMTKLYGATDEMHTQSGWHMVPDERKRSGRAIEVGHIFSLGQKYTHAMDVHIAGPQGEISPYMGCYGIGISRLVGAIIEASHDDNGIIWPQTVAPYKASILNLKMGDEICDRLCETLYRTDPQHLLYDDRKIRAGGKFADADLMGHPWQIIVGPKNAKRDFVELKCRKTGERVELPTNAVFQHIADSII